MLGFVNILQHKLVVKIVAFGDHADVQNTALIEPEGVVTHWMNVGASFGKCQQSFLPILMQRNTIVKTSQICSSYIDVKW